MPEMKLQTPQEMPEFIEKQLLAVEMIPVSELTVDHTYQHPEDPTRINKMVKNWDWNGCGHLAVSLHQGAGKNKGKTSYYAVIDGQQRLAAIRMLGYTEAPCRIYIDLTKEQEAQLYELLNSGKQPTTTTCSSRV